MVKNLPANAGDVRDEGSIPGLGGSPGGGHSNTLWYSRLENPVDRGAWWATDLRITESDMTEATEHTAVFPVLYYLPEFAQNHVH